MNCETVERDNIIERYLDRSLTSEEQTAWEEHYFGCMECLEKLEVLQAVQRPLREIAARKPSRQPQWIWAAAGIAALLAVTAGVLWMMPRTQPVSPAIAKQTGPTMMELAQLDPPPYSPQLTRGSETPVEARFRAAMPAYQAKRYQEAVAGLQSALALDPQFAPARFFLGASYLLNGQSAPAIDQLNQVASGDSPFAEEARYCLAKAYLREDKRFEAARELANVIAQHGDWEKRARALLVQVNAAR
jgi:predicted Zn-dependent protease